MTEQQRSHIALLFDSERERLLNYIRARVPDEEDARDILQDVFLQMVSGYQEIRALEKATSWLFTVAKNKIIDRMRKRKPYLMSEIPLPGKGKEEPLMLEEVLPSTEMDAIDEMMREKAWQSIEKALDDLPPEQREVFVLHEFEDLSFRKISELTGEGVNTLLSRKRYAVMYLRSKLEELYKHLKD
jgi:RNA polymerase sigma factor (sigma-70 family)